MTGQTDQYRQTLTPRLAAAHSLAIDSVSDE